MHERTPKKNTLASCEGELWAVQHELTSFGFLLKHLAAENCEDLYGLGLSLERLAHEIAKVAERIAC